MSVWDKCSQQRGQSVFADHTIGQLYSLQP